AFAQLLSDTAHPHHVPGGRIVAAYMGGSPDFPLSANRVQGFAAELHQKYDVRLVDRIADLWPLCDAFLLESVDGRVHPAQLAEIVAAGKPVFVDKPLALSTEAAVAMVQAARDAGTPLMSCSSLRFSEALTAALRPQTDAGAIVGCDVFGPMAIEPTQPGLFWYGIHCVEVLFAALGPDCVSVSVTANADHDVVVGLWEDGRIGTIRGNRLGNYQFGALVHRTDGTAYADISGCAKPFYASLLERIVEFAKTGVPPFSVVDTVRIVQFIECANESRATSRSVAIPKLPREITDAV
ncbi:MAG: Gfo/Idh/MocA family oxidoreductase, partial [Alicyclobacillus sp.]|nr:Gfo/Idh/MocA family oxidoreductase [Alicyclobacillus sp.]